MKAKKSLLPFPPNLPRDLLMLTLKIHPVSLFNEESYPRLPDFEDAKEGEIVGLEMIFSTEDNILTPSVTAKNRVYIRQDNTLVPKVVRDCPEEIKEPAIRAWWNLVAETDAIEICRRIQFEIPDDMCYTESLCGYSLIVFSHSAILLEDNPEDNIYNGALYDEPLTDDVLGKAVRLLVPEDMSAHREIQVRRQLEFILGFFTKGPNTFVPKSEDGKTLLPVSLPASLK